MKFNMTVETVNRLLAFSKALKIDDPHQRFPMIQCNITENVLTAQFISNTACTEFTCVISSFEPIPPTGDFWLMPPQKRFTGRKDLTVFIENDDKATTYHSGEIKQVCEKPDDCSPDRFQMKYVWGYEPKKQLFVDAELLSRVLSSYGKDTVKMQYLGEKKGFYITNRQGEKSLVLPINPKSANF